MNAPDLVAGFAVFLVVAGVAATAWLRRGRDPRALDDDSILLPAPPDGMTAATATIVLGEDARTAFLAALLDLASRDEIAFSVEESRGPAAGVGIDIRGGESSDPRVRLNRRRPIGEGEEWLLGEIKSFATATAARAAGAAAGTSPEAMQAAVELFGASLRSLGRRDDGDGPAARAARERGLAEQRLPDLPAFAAAYEQKHGHAPAPELLAELTLLASLSPALGAAVAPGTDPDRFLDEIATRTGRTLSDKERASSRELIAALAEMPTTSGHGPARQISAAHARTLPGPFLLGPLLQRYALRHGWVAGMPLIARIKWRIVGAVEFLAGLLLFGVAASVPIGWLAAAGAGLLAGGGATYLIAPAMPSISVEGSLMKVQLQAYRRTLEAGFANAATFERAGAASRLTWLETPDQVIVWGVALGLRGEVEALLARTPAEIEQTLALAPERPESAGSGSRAIADPAEMFAAIAAIGSEAAGGDSR